MPPDKNPLGRLRRLEVRRLMERPDHHFPIRQESCHGEPRPSSELERTCRTCGASFVRLAPGKVGLRGIWHTASGLRWYCSQECFDAATLSSEGGKG